MAFTYNKYYVYERDTSKNTRDIQKKKNNKRNKEKKKILMSLDKRTRPKNFSGHVGLAFLFYLIYCTK